MANSKKGRSSSPARRSQQRPGRTMPGVTPVVTDVTISATSHKGPLPSPQQLAEYDTVVPGLAERIIRIVEIPLEMAQEQQGHRHVLETKVVTSDVRRSWAGLIFGLVVALVAIIGGIWLVDNGKSGEGLAAILAPIAGIVGAFAYGSYNRKKEREAKDPGSRR